MEASDPPSPHPRIRHIAGIAIHELTVPEARTRSSAGPLSFPVAPSGSPRARRYSHAGLDIPVGRARAPTLAGEGFNPSLIGTGAPPPTPAALFPAALPEDNTAQRPLVRCFVTFSLPPETSESASRPASPSLPSPPHSPNPRDNPTLKRPPPASSRSRTASLPPKPTVRTNFRSASPTSPTLPSLSPSASPASKRSQLNGIYTQPTSPTSAIKPRPAPARRSTLGYSGRATSDIGTPRSATSRPPPVVPFFFSPIHDPSTYPRWAHLEPGDLAPWLTVPEKAGTRVDVQVWIEEESKGKDKGENKWRRLPDVGGVVDLAQLVPIPRDTVLPPNTLQWTLSTHPKSIFYLPPPGTAEPDRDAMKRIVERSLRETRMKKGATFGALHQLINIQSVIADTQRSIEDLQRRIDGLLAADADRAVQRRDVSERALRVHWIKDRVAEVERTTEQTKARTTLQRGRLHSRRALLVAALEREEVNKSKMAELSAEITEVETERSALLPQIHKLRAMHAQTLDFIFPIVSIHAQSLLYSILGAPLPIPIGAKDPAPPLSLPPGLTPEGCPRVDERTTAAALGYAALVVHIISSFGGAAAGLAYPVTFAGSRSHVRDVVSVMQGPRSFPLYAKGVERYRFEYAVFLLNKDIEMLMLESDIRMLDLRHTLPNLKNLLVTLSSPDPPPPGPVAGPGWASGAASSASSRKPSAKWSMSTYRSSSTLCLDPNSTSRGSLLDRYRRLAIATPTVHSPSLASASIHSVCPTNEDASVLGGSAAVSPLPWTRTTAGGPAAAATAGAMGTAPLFRIGSPEHDGEMGAERSTASTSAGPSTPELVLGSVGGGMNGHGKGVCDVGENDDDGDDNDDGEETDREASDGTDGTETADEKR